MTAAFAFTVGRDRTDVHPALRAAGTFDELQDAVLTARHDRDKEHAPYYARPFAANGEGKPRRAKEHAEPCAWLALDVDHLDAAAAPRLDAELARWRGFWYSTASATADNLKRRVVLECSRIVTLAEHPRLVAVLEHELAQRIGDGIAFDSAASRDLARLWYLPTDGAQAGAFRGRPVDVDAALAHEARDEPHLDDEPQATGERIGAGGRNAALTREAGRLRRLGFSPTAIAALLHVVNRERCDPPLPANEVETIARSIGRYDPAADDSTADDAPAIIIGGALIEATKLPPARYVTRPLLVSGQLGTLTGHPGHAKTTFVVGMFVAFAADLPFGPLQPESDGLLYIVSAEDFEGTKNRILAEAARLRLNVDARAQVNARLRWARVAAIASPSTIREAIERDAAGRSIAAIFIDTGPALFPGDDENDNVALRDYLNGLLHFRALPGHPAVVVAWHPSKGAGPDRLEPRGASSIKGTGDFNLTIWKDYDGRVTVSYTKMRAAHFDPIEAALGSVDLTDDDGERFSVPVIDIAAAAVADRTDSREAREAILRHLYAHRSDPPTIRDTAAATGLSRAAVGRHLRYLAGARPAVVEMDPVDERYKLTTKGEARARMLAERSRRAYADIRG